MGAILAWPSARPVPTGPAAPRQFNPLVPYVSFGWLPPGQSLLSGSTGLTALNLSAGRTAAALASWDLTVYAAGQCHLTARAKAMDCSTVALEGLTGRISGHAPSVGGHRALWVGPNLVWQYARGGWAWLILPLTYASARQRAAKRAAARRDAVNIAGHIRFGAATEPLAFPAQLTHLPSQWRVSSVYYQPDAGVLRASRYALTTGTPNLGADSGLEYQRDLPWLTIDPATGRNSCGKGTPEIINGYPVVLTQMSAGTFHKQQLCAANAGGWALVLAEIGSHPAIDVASLFRNHLRLLGTSPATWASQPIG